MYLYACLISLPLMQQLSYLFYGPLVYPFYTYVSGVYVFYHPYGAYEYGVSLHGACGVPCDAAYAQMTPF